MNRFHGVVARFLLAGSLAAAMAGCVADTGEPGPPSLAPSSAPAAPKDALTASVQHLKTTSFRATARLSGGVTASAATDPVGKAGTSTISGPMGGGTLTVDQVISGGATYAKVTVKNVPGMPALPGWMKLDPAKLDKPENFDLTDPDPANLQAAVFGGLGTVEPAGDRRYKGTLDLTEASESGIVDQEVVADLKDSGTAVPFEATVDEKGRIATFKITVPKTANSDAETWEITYSDWGTAVRPEVPANAVPAPDAAYDFFNA